METARSVVTTLFDGDYVLGFGALVNSLFRNGFRGSIVAGHKSDLTGWSSAALGSESERVLDVSGGLSIEFARVEHRWHIANCKGHFVRSVWDKHIGGFRNIFFFDPDIVVRCRWSFFEEWAARAVTLCEENVMVGMPEDHPLRLGWIEWARVNGWSVVREMRGALNGGFFGVDHRSRSFIELYCQVMDRLGQEMSLESFTPGDRSELFCMTDQDVLCVVAMLFDGSISRLGPEGMDFVGGGFTMSHSVGGDKPWRKKFVRSALSGVPPTLADKGWAANLEGPIQVLPPPRVRAIRRSIRVASAIGRFIRRS